MSKLMLVGGLVKAKQRILSAKRAGGEPNVDYLEFLAVRLRLVHYLSLGLEDACKAP
jgi:hypothetical protein